MKRKIIGVLMALTLGALMQTGTTCFGTGSGTGTVAAGGGGALTGTPVTGTVGNGLTGVSPLY